MQEMKMPAIAGIATAKGAEILLSILAGCELENLPNKCREGIIFLYRIPKIS